ncbi:MAG: hypothetical protein IPO69_02860 [Saprospiraceae bacterium]|nr:hypothetical protein [Saprospiraceae bacterium]
MISQWCTWICPPYDQKFIPLLVWLQGLEAAFHPEFSKNGLLLIPLTGPANTAKADFG